ncbi:MAG TPA: IclR family transcriptional regulator [Firmicutes bacterium]|nr:IclR family transcriptional regulator [Bacillota bacterium]
MSISQQQNRNLVRSVAKCFAVLESLANHEGSMKLSELSKALGLPPSTTHRLVSSLMEIGYVTQDRETGEYMLGVKILFLAGVVLKRLDLRKIAYPFLEKLRDETGETANLVVLDSDEVLYIEKVESRASIRAFSLIGRRAPVHATGVGKVILADMAWPEVVEILEKKGMPRLTSNTITDPKQFMKELNRVRLQGYALDREECEEGAICVAAPVRDHNGKTVAGMSISGPIGRLTEDRLPLLIQIVMKYAAGLSRALGYVDRLTVGDDNIAKSKEAPTI